MPSKRSWIYDLLLIAVLLLAAYLRVTGVEWGEGYHQHPDELFMTGVVENLRAHSCMDEGTPIEACPPERQRWMTVGEYFDTANSTLNPRNRGAGFYVYGNLPVTLVRVTYEAIPEIKSFLAEKGGWLSTLSEGLDTGPMKYFGRQFSALADLFAILVMYFIVARLYNQKTALLAALFSSLAVMQIQQSHYFTVDLFMNSFMYAALYFAVRIAYDKSNGDEERLIVEDVTQYAPRTTYHVFRNFWREPLFWQSLLFGLFLGMAAASKVNAAVMAVLLPVALALRFGNWGLVTGNSERKPISNYYLLITLSLLVGGLATILSFRVFQPYAFDTILPNEQWLKNMAEIRAQATGLADLPWNLQWARRTHLYSFTNLTVWGLGLPLGILAWTGFLVMGWRIFKNREPRHILLWSWTALYFAWQSLQFNATMRYQLPIYPLLAMMAAWFVFDGVRNKYANSPENVFLIPNSYRLTRNLLYFVGAIALALTAVWAFAFLKVYTRPETRIEASHWIYQNVPGPIALRFADGFSQSLPFPADGIILGDAPYQTTFNVRQDGMLTEIHFPHILSNFAAAQTLSVSLLDAANSASPLATASIEDTFAPDKDSNGKPFTLKLSQPVPLAEGQSFILRVETTGALTLAGAGIANETDYDWNLPFNVDGYDAFGGIYRGELNLQVYWDDNADKLARFTNSLNQTDYIFIPTNHQYAQIPRIPERYPLTTVYYRELVGCPPDEDIIWCYRVAEPGMFEGRLGFDLVKTFTSYPTLGPIVINDGAAEEAFTFYDHPKVLIFKKNADYNAAKVAATLGAVDLTKVVRLVPKDAASYKPPKSTLLPADKLTAQQAGGTWSELFDYEKLQNKYPAVGALGWYAFIFWMGLVTYPLARRALPGLADKGYALSRTLGLVIFAYAAWILGSLGVPVSRGLLGIIFGAMTLIGAWQAWVQKDALASDWKSNRRWFVIVELLFLALFVIDLAIRLGNPDLWHPYKGGERPMDFSYFNAVIKSTVFPPYDPWFAGGYINYYYYGFVLVGIPVKFLGVVPSIAYNFILPTLFALVGVSAFAIGSNLVRRSDALKTDNWSLITGLAASSFTLLLGNLGTIQMLIRAFQRLGAPGGQVDAAAGFFQRFSWGLDGFAKSLAGEALPLGRGDWYWLPSRVIPAPGDVEPITEFPLFTFLYSDLHAHMIVLMLALFMIAWGLSIVVFLRNTQYAIRTPYSVLRNVLPSIVLGALVLGAIYPTNTWDAYTYLPLSALALGYALFNALGGWTLRAQQPTKVGFAGVDATLVARFAISIAGALALILLAFLFYQPYFQAWGSGYNSVARWNGGHTPLSSYFTHWGVFLFILFAWMVWETREWMAATPLSSLSKLKPYQLLIEIVLAVFFVAMAYLLYRKAVVSLVALPMAFWAAILILRTGQNDAKRWVLFMVGTSLVLTIAVELIVVVGDVGRMNTVFKLYLQAWTMLSVSAAAALGWTFPAVPSWKVRWRGVWQVGLTILLAGAAFFTVSATMDKIRDRMNLEAPNTLDSMTFMATTVYWDAVDIELGQDYRGIRWMQENVQGSPVIVEANCVEYRWCTRYTIYTGLPGVVGWNWHQRQQRGFVEPLIIENRIGEITAFYTTIDPNVALAFLKKFNVRYIVVGQVEAIYYPGEGLFKFEQYDGQLWNEVFRDGSTVIYEVR